MPLYEYACAERRHRFQIPQRLGDDATDGSPLGAKPRSILEKQFSTFAKTACDKTDVRHPVILANGRTPATCGASRGTIRSLACESSRTAMIASFVVRATAQGRYARLPLNEISGIDPETLGWRVY